MVDKSQAVAEPSRNPSSETEARVLVVEDDRDLQDAIVGILQDEGIACHGTPDAWEAIDWMAVHEPKLVILDMMMPRMNGWEFLEHRKRDPRLGRIPVIVVTAAAQARLEQMPVDGILMKPVGRATLVNAVKRYL